ncbi:hypothetical protein K474DRAFT_1607117, partial [Panus rudis PR-1116 ss-1]
TCILDILRHIPRCAFSEKQNIIIHWAMRALGLGDIPSESTMRNVDNMLQKLCGIDSVHFEGALGHVYYTNDLAAIIAQAQMANPLVRPHLHFLPEDAGSHLSEAWQGSRWLHELIPQLGTQMIGFQGQDYYLFEPALLENGQACVPIRWFIRRGRTYALAHNLIPYSNGWLVDTRSTHEVPERSFILPFPLFRQFYHSYNYPSPTCIFGCLDATGGISPWQLSNPSEGNPWRAKAKGSHVLAFPIWLYCDDTSGNVSKCWNKHNSVLFTAAGLPRRLVHKEYNIHFLTTSNGASPLEILDGVVQQLRECQTHGIWAWDSTFCEWVLLIPSVLAILGDNPMQSEFSCHIGLKGKFFCRSCSVSNSRSFTELSGADSDESDASSINITGNRKKKGRKRQPESMQHMVNRITEFMQIGRPRTKWQTLQILQSQFTMATDIGGQAQVKRNMTETGVKDSYFLHFVSKLFKISTAKGKSRQERKEMLAQAISTFPKLLTAETVLLEHPYYRHG